MKIIAVPAFASSAMLLLAACAAGPDFKSPSPPQMGSYVETPISRTRSAPGIAGGEAQRFVQGLDIPGQWWALFHSRALDDLIERSLKANPDLKAARAALTVAQENVLAQRGAFYPVIAAGISVSRQKTSQDISPTPSSGELIFNLYTPQVTVSYVPDVFGLNRRTVEALQAQAEQARFALLAAQITLSANVAAAAIQEASPRAQIAATQKLIAVNGNVLGILQQQYAKGYVGRLEVAAQEVQLAQVRATLPPLLKQLAQERDLLAALSGGFPSRGLPEKFELSSMQLPQELPLSLPSQLVAQRPDVRQAEENLHAASAQIGIAAANRLPSITISAEAGNVALAAADIFSSATGFWTLAGGLAQPIFEGGALMHRERAARAAYVQAADEYRATVLTAFQNVADTLHALQQDADGLRAAAAAKDAAGTTLDLARKQFQAGYANYLAVLAAEQGYQQALISFVQAQAARYVDTVALFQALGGGWWNQSDNVAPLEH